MPKISNIYFDNKRKTWYFSASLGFDRTGKRVQVVRRGFKTQREAKEAFDKYMSNNSKSALTVNSTMLYEEFFNDYFLPEYKRSVSDRTYNNRLSSMRKHFIYFFNAKLKDIDAPLVHKWKNKLSQEYTNGYIRSVFGTFQLSLDLAIKMGFINTNIAKDVGNVKKKSKQVEFWTKQEFEMVLGTFDMSNYYDLFSFTMLYLLFMSGLRFGEAQALEWSDLDFDSGIIVINKTMFYQNASTYYTHPPKTKSSNRTIALDPNTLEHLKTWKEVQEKNLGNTKYILSYNGIPTNKSAVKHVIERHSELAGVHRIKTHALRHSHASLLISLGESALVIKDRLGHEDVETTLGTYGHLYPNTNLEVVKKLTNLIDVKPIEPVKERKFVSNQFVKQETLADD